MLAHANIICVHRLHLIDGHNRKTINNERGSSHQLCEEVEATRQFLLDEWLKKGNELEKWAIRFLLLRDQVNKGKLKRSEATVKVFQNFQEEVFYEAMNCTTKEACAASVDTSMSGEGSSDRDCLDVLQGEKESLLSPLHVVIHVNESGELRH